MYSDLGKKSQKSLIPNALYELGMPKGKFENTVISDSPSLGLHESQSRFWENMIARSREFWRSFYPVCDSIWTLDRLLEFFIVICG